MKEKLKILVALLFAAPFLKMQTIAQTSQGMTLIPAGTFTMGSPNNESGRDSDEAQHTVTISRRFYMDATEITKFQWDAVRAPAFPFELE